MKHYDCNHYGHLEATVNIQYLPDDNIIGLSGPNIEFEMIANCTQCKRELSVTLPVQWLHEVIFRDYIVKESYNDNS